MVPIVVIFWNCKEARHVISDFVYNLQTAGPFVRTGRVRRLGMLHSTVDEEHYHES